MKRFLASLLVGLMLATASWAVAAEQPIKLIVNGQEVPSDPAPRMIDNRVFVPLRFVAEALSAKVEWYNGTVVISSSGANTSQITNQKEDSQMIHLSEVMNLLSNERIRIQRTSPDILSFKLINETRGLEIAYTFSEDRNQETTGEVFNTNTNSKVATIKVYTVDTHVYFLQDELKQVGFID